MEHRWESGGEASRSRRKVVKILHKYLINEHFGVTTGAQKH